jgi:hypothetical protein
MTGGWVKGLWFDPRVVVLVVLMALVAFPSAMQPFALAASPWSGR